MWLVALRSAQVRLPSRPSPDAHLPAQARLCPANNGGPARQWGWPADGAQQPLHLLPMPLLTLTFLSLLFTRGKPAERWTPALAVLTDGSNPPSFVTLLACRRGASRVLDPGI